MPTLYSWVVSEPSTPSVLPGDAPAPGANVIRNLLLDPLTGDLVVSGGNLQLVSGSDAIQQGIRARVMLVLSEWFADLSIGVDWFGTVLVKNPNMTSVRADLEENIQAVQGVTGIQSMTLDFDSGRRTLSMGYDVTTDVGQLAGNVQVGA